MPLNMLTREVDHPTKQPAHDPVVNTQRGNCFQSHGRVKHIYTLQALALSVSKTTARLDESLHHTLHVHSQMRADMALG